MDFGRNARAALAALAAAGVAGWITWPSLAAALLAAALTALGMPLFRAYATARPNARSSHDAPTPQGGGLAIVAATLLMILVLDGVSGFPSGTGAWLWLIAGILLLAVTGAVDDIRGVPVVPRLAGQLLAVAIVVLAQFDGARLFPLLPFWMEASLLIVAGAWFVNLTNFMDGIDGITLAGFLPLAAAAILLGEDGYLGREGQLLATCFLGALAGFVFFNFPRAKLFLGDAGSLPIGLIGGALLLDLALHGALAAAVILPLYPFTDATLTLIKRLVRREKVWEAHRQHAYQSAVMGGWSHGTVSGIILALNIGLAGLALLSAGRSAGTQAMIVIAAVAAVMAVILLFRSRRPTA
jgi:UDP-N-acetylmuramyl pentapeptide phosphotransferase/UDP-N-acetylglucosamine-1-phosphate transferase